MWVKILKDSVNNNLLFKNTEGQGISQIRLWEDKACFYLIIWTNSSIAYEEVLNGMQSEGITTEISDQKLVGGVVFRISHSRAVDELKKILMISASLEPSLREIYDELMASTKRLSNERNQTIASLTLLRDAIGTLSLTDRLEIIKHSPIHMKKMLGALADRLLNNNLEFNEDTLACKRIVELLTTDTQFMSLFHQIMDKRYFRIVNVDDLKYCLRKTKYTDEFLPGSDKYKREHCQLAHTLAKQFMAINPNDLLNDEIDLINNIRTKLININQEKLNIRQRNKINFTLLILAKYWPLNDEDPITLEKIASSRRVFTGSGHQFDLPTLLLFLNDYCRDGQYRHPITNTAFRNADINHIEKLLNPSSMTISGNIMDNLYDYRVTEAMELTTNALLDVNLNCRGVIQIERISHLDEKKRNRLISSILKHHKIHCPFGYPHYHSNDFFDGMHRLLKRGLSIEQFARFDDAKQEKLALNEIFLVLIVHGADADNLFDLSAQNLDKLFYEVKKDFMALTRKVLAHENGAIDNVNALILDLKNNETELSRSSRLACVD